MNSAAAITSRAKALALVGVAGPAASLLRILRRAADFTLTFRRLCAADADETADVKARGLLANPGACDSWATRWRSRLAVDGREPYARAKSMRDVNPVFIPRNHRVEQARHRESLEKMSLPAAIAPTRSSSTLR